ncbi:MAG TPA: RtcB family protein [Armatimonadota bacterium]|jgi:tRNA-splicing ligase RtcB
MNLKSQCERKDGYYELSEGVELPIRLFLNEPLFREAEETVFTQAKAATEFPGVRDVVITPDTHSGFVVPIGCVMATEGTLCQAPVGYDIGCGMAAFRSDATVERDLTKGRLQEFSRRVMERVGMGAGHGSGYEVTPRRFQEVIRQGARALGESRDNVERDFLPVEDSWDPPKGSRCWRGQTQLGSLGGGNHFLEVQHDQDGHLWCMVHTGSRGFGHGLATWYIQKGKEFLQARGIDMRGGAEAVYFTQDNPLYTDYKNAVAAGANYAIANRLLIWLAAREVFESVFCHEAELVYEISHNLVQEEYVPSLGGTFMVHRKGATRAFPAGHPMLKGTRWEATGHPVLIPGSMGDTSYVLFAEPGVEHSLYSVNHGCGRKMSRTQAKKSFTQQQVNRRMAELGVLVNGGGDVPIDESPFVYKSSSEVIAAVVEAGLARVAYTLTPLASLKGVD